MVKVFNKTKSKVEVSISNKGGVGDDKWYTVDSDSSDSWTRSDWEVVIAKFGDDSRSGVYVNLKNVQKLEILGKDSFYIHDDYKGGYSYSLGGNNNNDHYKISNNDKGFSENNNYSNNYSNNYDNNNKSNNYSNNYDNNNKNNNYSNNYDNNNNNNYSNNYNNNNNSNNNSNSYH
jgi:hypothetical protein